MTAGDLINGSLRLIGVLASGESPSASESIDALSSLNSLIDSWSTESLMIPARVQEAFALVAGQQTYTMGVGGDFDTSRPIKLENVLIQFASVTPVLELPMKLLNNDQYAGITQKAITSTFPTYVYADNANPLCNLSVWPVPVSGGNNLSIWSWKPLSNLAGLTTAIALPPGYERALKYNLAIDLAPEYGRSAPAEVVAIAQQAKADIKRPNYRPQLLRVDDALISRSATWNWMTGEPQ